MSILKSCVFILILFSNVIRAKQGLASYTIHNRATFLLENSYSFIYSSLIFQFSHSLLKYLLGVYCGARMCRSVNSVNETENDPNIIELKT